MFPRKWHFCSRVTLKLLCASRVLLPWLLTLRAGIYDAILLVAALCFWNSASNTFNFRLGPMTPTLLDMAQIFGFITHGRPADLVD
ncbi:unnamed protein product, partial [Prunus brigantina]